MKKIIALLMVIVMMIPLATVASAAESSTTLTMEVPSATYTLSIPQNQTATFGLSLYGVEGDVMITDSEGFSVYKNVSVTISYDAFSSETTSTTIPFEVLLDGDFVWKSGESIIFKGNMDGSVNQYPTINGTVLTNNDLMLEFGSSDIWAKAMAGTYTATLTFTSEVVPA